MTNTWNKFIDILSQMLGNAQDLLALSKEKRLVLTDRTKADVDALVNITKKEEILVLKLNKSEKERQALTREIASLSELAGAKLASELVTSISQIKTLADQEHAKQIEELGGQLKICVNEIAALNELNSKLIMQYLEFLEFNINILSAASCEQTYSTTPQKEVQRRAILNAQA